LGRSTTQLGIGVALLAVFVAATAAVTQTGTADWEIDVVRWAHGLSDGWAWVLWLPMQLGTAPGAIVVAFGVGLAVGHRAGLIVFASYAIASVVANLTKRIVERPRPTKLELDVDPRTMLDTFAFPSGHAAQAVAVAVAVAFVATPWGRWRFALVPMTALPALARMYYGVHYPGDLLAGASLGIGVALVVDAVAHGPPPSGSEPSS